MLRTIVDSYVNTVNIKAKDYAFDYFDPDFVVDEGSTPYSTTVNYFVANNSSWSVTARMRISFHDGTYKYFVVT